METLHYEKGDDHTHWSQAFVVHIDTGKLQNDRHQKWSTYLQQFHLNINYKTYISNSVANYLSWPPVAALTTVLHSCGYEASEWPQLY